MSLYVVATPIGNLDDITLRAIETLKSVDFIVCEDTRHTLQLLNHLGIKKSLISYHQHSKTQKVEQIIDALKDNKKIAIVSDAGTPGISDPGEILIKRSYEANIEVIPIPGVSALTSILSISGMELKECLFYGFLPNKKGRQTKILEIVGNKNLSVIYESPFRIKKLLNELVRLGGNRQVVVGRELTKKFETIYRGKVSEVLEKIIEKGEFVLILTGRDD